MKHKGRLFLVFGLLFLVQAGGIAWSQTTERVSVDTTGNDADSASNNPSTSANGRYVAFQSDATDLVTGGSNGSMHIFVRDRQTPTTIQVSLNSLGNEELDPSRTPSISGDGMHVAFESDADLAGGDANAFSDIFVRDLLAVTTTLVSVDSTGAQDIGPSVSPSVSSDGRYVAFQSEADLVLPDNGFIDIYVHDRDADDDGTYDEAGSISTVRVSVDSAGIQGQGNNHSYFPSISADGRYVAFESIATDLVAGSTNGNVHIFVRDLLAGTTALVSVDSSDVQGNDDSSSASISADGRYVAFESLSTNLVAGGTNGNVHIFVRDRQTGITTIVSVDSGGTEGNLDSSAPAVSADGKFVAFESLSSNLVTGDGNGSSDIFTYERESLPPNVDSTSPTHNANGVAVGATITATFSESMNGSTIDTNTFTLDNGTTGTVTYDANSTTARFTPTRKLDYDTTYTATITAAAEDLAGNSMLADYSWSFTTQSEENNSGGSGPCFIATAAYGFGMAGEVK
jgi:Tol biopolymer transport system component